MSGLQDFLTPFSHLVFANRDKVIVLLAALLAWFTIQLLVSRWRNERLERDLAAAKTAGPSSGGRRYATSVQVEEPPAVESGVLPPVKGGRTYARNLGTALQKAGIAAPQIYSPPAPAGWAPNSNPAQPGMGQPGAGQQPYAPQNAPWAAPPAQQGSPWGYPAGAGRGMPGPAPTGAPFYQPQPPAPQPPSPPQPMTPPAGMPGPYGPPAAPPFGQPAFQPSTSAAPAPNFAPPGPPAAPPVMPPLGGNPPAVESPAAEPPAADGGRRGKPKRRRFNFNVLENLEKMVQPKTAEPLPPTGWTPPATPPAPPIATAAPAPSVPASPPIPEPTAAKQPVAEASAPAKPAPVEAESLPLRFGPEVEAEAESADEPEAAADLAASDEKEQEPNAVAEIEAQVAAEPEPQPEPAPEPKREARGSMGSMLFGEEAVSAEEVQPTEESAWSEPEPLVVEPAAQAPEAEPTTEAPVNDPWRPWSSARDSEPEAQPELVPITGPDERADAEVPGSPVGDAGDRPSAGTVVIIEDDPTAASYYATLFRGNGYQVEVANDGVSGVDLCTRTQPQLILLDVMMPRQNGILVLQTLRATDETKNTPVVVMSNFSEPTLIKRAIQLGALEYVIKTQVEGPALLNALPRWINHEKAFAAA